MKTLSLLAHASKLKKNSSKEITLNTTFADGTRVIANMTDDNYSTDGISLKPHQFIIV